MRSRGGETGGLTLMDALHLYEERGYAAQFGAREGGAVKCFTCGALKDPTEYSVESLRRIEGVSDPADESLVVAMTCPSCQARGTLTLMYGPMASPEDNEAFRRMRDTRAALESAADDARDAGGPPVGPSGPPALG